MSTCFFKLLYELRNNYHVFIVLYAWIENFSGFLPNGKWQERDNEVNKGKTKEE